jgi:hypothetical protein
VELPFYGFVGDEIERYGYQGIAPALKEHIIQPVHISKYSGNPVSSILFPSLS